MNNNIESYIATLPAVIKVKDLETILCISHNTAYDLVQSGKIRAIRIGNRWRIPREAVAEYLSQSTSPRKE